MTRGKNYFSLEPTTNVSFIQYSGLTAETLLDSRITVIEFTTKPNDILTVQREKILKHSLKISQQAIGKLANQKAGGKAN